MHSITTRITMHALKWYSAFVIFAALSAPPVRGLGNSTLDKQMMIAEEVLSVFTNGTHPPLDTIRNASEGELAYAPEYASEGELAYAPEYASEGELAYAPEYASEGELAYAPWASENATSVGDEFELQHTMKNATLAEVFSYAAEEALASSWNSNLFFYVNFFTQERTGI